MKLRAVRADRTDARHPPRPFTAHAPHHRYAEAPRTALADGASLGCAVVRRVTDGEGRAWSVREMGSADARASTIHVDHHTALLFRCEAPGVRSEIRRVSRPLESLRDGALRALLHRRG
jgi:hypothetical protein